MKIRRLCFLILCIGFCVILSSCNKVTKSNYQKIELGMSKQAVIQILGIPDDTDIKITSDVCYWFDKAENYPDALEKVKEGNIITYISVVFSTELTGKSQIVLSKKMGTINEEIGEKDK